MILHHYDNKSEKLEKALIKYLHGMEKSLIEKYGSDKTRSIIRQAKASYPEIITKMPFFNTPMYDSLIVLSSKMMALKKGMKYENICTEEFIAFSMETLETESARIPKFLRNLQGRLFVSKIFRPALKKVAKSASVNGWPTELIDGNKETNYDMKICTKECQMVNFVRSIGEEDMISYCAFSDFANAESLGYGLKQTSTIDSGVCTFSFSKKGEVAWPEAYIKVKSRNQ